MDGVAGRADFAVQSDLVKEFVLAAAFVYQPCFDIDKVPEAARALVLHVQFEDGACETFAFDFVVRGAHGTEKVNACLLEPNGVGGVVDDAHGVGFGVTDFDVCFKSKIVIHECNYK